MIKPIATPPGSKLFARLSAEDSGSMGESFQDYS